MVNVAPTPPLPALCRPLAGKALWTVEFLTSTLIIFLLFAFCQEQLLTFNARCSAMLVLVAGLNPGEAARLMYTHRGWFAPLYPAPIFCTAVCVMQMHMCCSAGLVKSGTRCAV